MSEREMDAAYAENDRLVAEINRRRGYESALRSVFTEIGIANKQDGITLTAANKAVKLNEIRIAWRKAARFMYETIQKETLVGKPLNAMERRDIAEIASLITAAADLEDQAAKE